MNIYFCYIYVMLRIYFICEFLEREIKEKIFYLKMMKEKIYKIKFEIHILFSTHSNEFYTYIYDTTILFFLIKEVYLISLLYIC